MDNVHSLVREDWSTDQEFIHALMKNKLIVVNVGQKDLILIGQFIYLVNLVYVRV